MIVFVVREVLYYDSCMGELSALLADILLALEIVLLSSFENVSVFCRAFSLGVCLLTLTVSGHVRRGRHVIRTYESLWQFT